MEINSRGKWSLIGIPDHEAVSHLGGRLGASRGPKSFRKVFERVKSRFKIQSHLEINCDVSPLGVDIKENHEIAARLISEAHQKTDLCVVIGGSHDHGFSHLKGIYETLGPQKKLGCVNIDAHLDVRPPSPKITSGSPFFLAIESGVLEGPNLVEFGIQEQCNSAELWEYVKKHEVPVFPWNEMRGSWREKFCDALKSLSSRCDEIAISLDLDAASQAFAPGVSAPQAEGFTADQMIECIEIAARNPKTKSLGIFELNPDFDQDERTSRLAVSAAFQFIRTSLFTNPIKSG